MKDDAKLCFSFHHARPEGWAAIGDALINAGFYIMEAFPVYAELMASTPKAGAKEPISLDTIIICAKQKQAFANARHIASEYLEILLKLSDNISRSDVFTLFAAQTVVNCVNQRKKRCDIHLLLEDDLLFSKEHNSATASTLSNRAVILQNNKEQQMEQLSLFGA